MLVYVRLDSRRSHRLQQRVTMCEGSLSTAAKVQLANYSLRLLLDALSGLVGTKVLKFIAKELLHVLLPFGILVAVSDSTCSFDQNL